ncbi:MAG: glycosyltransferase family A protein, partial [Rivularia sp. (in: cyanobacteria)]
QIWMQKAQQIQDELTQTQETLKNLQSWNIELQAGKDWLETQWQTWMLRTQKAELEWQRWQSIASMMANSKFWHLRKAWLKLKNIIKTKIDPLELASQVNSEKDIRDYVTSVATQKVRYFQPEAVETPVVSIISVFFNDYEYFETTYRSVINQTWQNFEWIIVNDGSTNFDAVAFIESLPQRTKKIKVVSNSNYQGEAAARNMAIAEAQGEYLLFVNLVDIIDPLYIEKSLLFLETHPEFSFVNSYSAVFQAQEYWWNHGFNKPAKLIQDNFVKGQLLYRKADFDELGGFDNELKYHADWERWLKAIANHQKGWTIPEYLECSRCTTFVAPAFEQDRSESKPAKELIQSRYREFFTSTPPQEISLNGESLNQQQLQLKIDAQNSIQYSSTNKNLLFFFSSLNSDIDKCNLELITRLEQQDYKITAIATTKERASNSFYNVTPDIFHLPNFLDEAYWLAFTRYIIEYRQIDTIIISHVDIAYYFLPLLRAEFPQVAFIDLGYNNSNFSNNGNIKSSQFSKYLDRQLVFSPSLDNIVDENSKLICSSNVEIEAIFTNEGRRKKEEVRSKK